MKKNLLALGLLAISYSVQAQNVLLHVDTDANMYVSNGTLLYNGGGLQTRTTGKIENRGNIMVVGSASDVFKTLDTTGDKLDGGNIVMKLTDPANPVTSPYGQLYITGISQANITGIVDKEYASTKHGAYQQIGIPFIDKTFASLNTQFAGNFNSTRWSGREILKWSNANVRWDGSIIPAAPITSASTPGIAIDLNSATTAQDRTAYYTFGGANFNPELLHTVTGKPYADGITGPNVVNLTPSSITTYGVGGNNSNIYRERYNTYINDVFDNAVPWVSPTFGKYIYQFSNPYLTNLDLSLIGFDETTTGATIGDNNAISNIWGVVVNPANVAYNSNTGTTSGYAAAQIVTFDENTKKPVGNFDALIIKPLGTFKIKLRNSTPQTLDFDNLRRFSTTPRAEDVSYTVTANKNTNTNTGSIKQLGVLALDINGKQIGETYYVVAPQFATGHINDPSLTSVQAMTSTDAIIQTFEENVSNGGIDQNYSSAYRLYINEANETNFLGKRVDLNVFGSNVKFLKFEIRDNTNLIQNGTHALSSGTGFYYTTANGQPVQAKQGDVVAVNNTNYGLFYGLPQNTLDTNDVKPTSRTLVTYNPDVKNYIVRFDPDWKSASVQVFDASGKLVISEKSVKTDSDYVIRLDSSNKAVYFVKVVDNSGNTVNAKILIK